jgi:nitrogenase molybdenum-iron protein alpha/beta subunit
MPECADPLWACAMTGAAACLAGFRGLSVIIHGSSGCYYYPATLLHAPLKGTFMLERDVIFGSEERLWEVIGELTGNGTRIAVITTCVPAVLGEDIRSILSAHDVILVDSPGFAGDVEKGYQTALSTLSPQVDTKVPGINIDGVSLIDPFSKGNVQEIIRLLGIAGIPTGTVFSQDRLEKVWQAAPYTIGTNEDFPSGVGTYLGGTLGFRVLANSFRHISEVYESADITPVCEEIEKEEERVIYACDKYLRRFDPPSVAIFAGASYAEFAANLLERYLDADILAVGTRNAPPESSRHPVEQVQGLHQVRECIERLTPDLVIGSSFERSVSTGRAFVGMTPPFRGRVRLTHQPLAGVGGALHFTEEVLNACIEHKPAVH